MIALDVSDLSFQAVEARLGKDDFRIDAESDLLTLLARSPATTFHVGGSVRLDLERIGPPDCQRGSLSAGRIKLARADHALLALQMVPPLTKDVEAVSMFMFVPLPRSQM